MSSSRKRNSTAIVAAILLGLLFIPSVGQAERKFFPASANGVPGRYGVALMLGQTASAAPEPPDEPPGVSDRSSAKASIPS